MNKTAVAIIPARGGSKRVPRKNVRPMAGTPLIQYTIDAALRSGVFDRVLVSTDCHEIASVAVAAGAEVPFLRDASLADDITPVSVATVDMLRRIDSAAMQYREVCQLMANCPLRDATDIRNSYRQFVASTASVQMSVMRYSWQNPWWAMRLKGGNELEPVFPEALESRSQDLPELFCPTGAIWWAQCDVLCREGTFHLDGRTGWEIGWQHGMDIDTEEDWAIAETLMALEHKTSTGG